MNLYVNLIGFDRNYVEYCNWSDFLISKSKEISNKDKKKEICHPIVISQCFYSVWIYLHAEKINQLKKKNNGPKEYVNRLFFYFFFKFYENKTRTHNTLTFQKLFNFHFKIKLKCGTFWMLECFSIQLNSTFLKFVLKLN